MEDKKIVQTEESIEIILSMINQAKVNLRDSGFYFLFWGWLIMILNLSHFILAKYTAVEQPYMVWFGAILGGIVSFIYGFIKGSKAARRTYADKIYMWIWIGFIVSFALTFIFVSTNPTLIVTMSMVFAGFATFLSGIVLKFRPLVIGGILFWLFSIACFAIGNEYALLISSIAVFIGYLIPGYLLRNKAEDVTV